MIRQFAVLLAIAMSTAAFAKDDSHEADRLKAAGETLQEILNIPDDLPKPLLNRAECVIVFPSVKKFAIGIGGSYGRGAMSCRSGKTFTGPWGAPVLYALEGANIGVQLGGQETDFVLLVMNPKGVESVMKSKVKLGGDVAAVAGPKGRDAEAATDALMRAEILSYSRARGLFAGVSLEGSTLRQDGSANRKVYGRQVTARDIVAGRVHTPAAGALMVSTLEHASPRNLSDKKSLKRNCSAAAAGAGSTWRVLAKHR
ncbi:MAG TPA: lipid-binding SYLF domain-containing protein [Terriglobales bacterium]|nr:lipid-binding SYLF domain-containing protein [Terriglobales bacterium]